MCEGALCEVLCVRVLCVGVLCVRVWGGEGYLCTNLSTILQEVF